MKPGIVRAGSHRLHLVIFDVDGTLIDSQAHIVEAQRRAFAACRVPAPTRARSLSVVGLSLHEAFAALVGEGGPIADLAAAYKAAWTDLRAEPGFVERLYPGVADMVADLAGQPDVTLGIATGKSRKGVDRVLLAQDWGGVFATVQTADDHPSKPHPSMLHAALAETGLPANAATFVGDTTFDMTMGVAAGIRSIGVAWGYHEAATLTTCGAQAVARDCRQLRDILDRTMDETRTR